jgi:hypothetical protein
MKASFYPMDSLFCMDSIQVGFDCDDHVKVAVSITTMMR